jgi:hypothetical protein
MTPENGGLPSSWFRAVLAIVVLAVLALLASRWWRSLI